MESDAEIAPVPIPCQTHQNDARRRGADQAGQLDQEAPGRTRKAQDVEKGNTRTRHAPRKNVRQIATSCVRKGNTRRRTRTPAPKKPDAARPDRLCRMNKAKWVKLCIHTKLGKHPKKVLTGKHPCGIVAPEGKGNTQSGRTGRPDRMGSGTRRIPKNEDLNLDKIAVQTERIATEAARPGNRSTRDPAERRPGRSETIRTGQPRQADPEGKRPETREGRRERSTGSEVI